MVTCQLWDRLRLDEPGILRTPDGKRLTSTCDWPHWKAHEWPKQKAAVQKKFPSVTFS